MRRKIELSRFLYFSLIRRLLVREPAKRAGLDEIARSPWVRAGDLDHAAAVLPLVSGERVTEETHARIVEQMVDGNIAEADEIRRYVV